MKYSTPIIALCMALFASSCDKEAPLPPAQEATVAPDPASIAADMVCGIWPALPSIEACTLVSVSEPLPLWPEALSLSPSRSARLVWSDGRTLPFPHELSSPRICEIPIRRSMDSLPERLATENPSLEWQVLDSPLRAGDYILALARLSKTSSQVLPENLEASCAQALFVLNAADNSVSSFWPLSLPLEALIALSPEKRELYALSADQRIASLSLSPGAKALSLYPDPGMAYPADHEFFDTWSPSDCDRDASSATGLDPCVPNPDSRAQAARSWALVPPAEALSAMRRKTRELLRPEGEFEFLDVSFQTAWSRVPPRGAILLRMANPYQRSVRIRLDSPEDYLMILFDDAGQRLADNMGYEAEKTLSRTLPAGQVHWLAVAFLHAAKEPARLVVQDTENGKTKDKGGK